MSFATTIPHIVLLNLDPMSKDYKVTWEFNKKIDKWTVFFEEFKITPFFTISFGSLNPYQEIKILLIK